MAWCFVSPASRGIGFELAKQLLATTTVPVVATARDPKHVKERILSDCASDVDSERLQVLKLDCTDETSIAAAAATVHGLYPPSTHHLRLAFAIPGVLHPEKSPAQIDANKALETFKINTIGPMLIMKHFSAFLPKKKMHILNSDEHGLPPFAVYCSMAARVGSTTDNQKGGWYSYRASKAGVTSVMKTFDLYLQQTSGDQAIAIALHPGTVKTGLSKDYWATVKPEQLFAPEFAAAKLIDVARSTSLSGRGKCWDWKGDEIKP